VNCFLRKLTIYGLDNIGLVAPGDDIARMICEKAAAAGLALEDGDLVVISQKVISKAQGLLIDASTVVPSRRAKALAKRTKKDPRVVEIILRDSAAVLRADRQAFVVKRKDGLVCLNAGVDKSNVNGHLIYTRLPSDSDSAANEILARLHELTGKRLAVMIADTYSRPLRVGQVEFAIGLAGMEPIMDYRGLDDMFGYSLRYKYVALADEAAAAAELIMGQGTEHTPVAVIRGLDRINWSEDRHLARKLLLERRLDLFR